MQRTSLQRKRRKSLKDMKTGPNLYSFTWLIWQCTVLIRTTLCKFQPLSSGNSITSKTYGVESLQECSIKYLNHLLKFSYFSTRNVQQICLWWWFDNISFLHTLLSKRTILPQKFPFNRKSLYNCISYSDNEKLLKYETFSYHNDFGHFPCSS